MSNQEQNREFRRGEKEETGGVVVIVIWGEEHLWMGLEDGFKEKALLLLHH